MHPLHGGSAADAVHNSVVLEEVAMMAIQCRQLNSNVTPMPQGELEQALYEKARP
jgi:L-ribulose-5-phosphate 4-epimerase